MRTVVMAFPFDPFSAKNRPSDRGDRSDRNQFFILSQRKKLLAMPASLGFLVGNQALALAAGIDLDLFLCWIEGADAIPLDARIALFYTRFLQFL
jgi:hypothetical protein